LLDKLRDQMTAYLSQHQVCVLSIAGRGSPLAMPVRYRLALEASVGQGLEVECLVPRWADMAYHLEQDPKVLLVIQGCQVGGLRWLKFQGTARPVAAPNWDELLPTWTSSVPPGDLYLVVRVTPQRIDLFDESQGWGVRETLEL